MKALAFMLPVIAVIAVSVIGAGCSKAIDNIRNHPGDEIKYCQIEKFRLATSISSNPLYPDSDYSTINISYNAAGDPVSMETSWDNPYNNLVGDDYHFRYDKQGRLTDYQDNYNFEAYGPGGILIWHRYSYPRRNVVVDSLYAYGDMQLNDPAPPQSSFEGAVTTYHLDGEGRIVQTQLSVNGGSVTVTNSNYDGRGNLIRDGVSYDNNVNPGRTNKVWMFINQDYSMNCPLAMHYTNFNAFGLPQDIIGGYIFGYIFQHMTISYACSPGTPSAGVK